MGIQDKVIFLCGFSGSGKTHTGEILARKIKYEYTDTDITVEETLNKSIPEIFAKLGEAKFRFAESDVIRMAVTRPPHVISLGGGAIRDEHSLDFIKGSGRLVYLKASAETIYDRLLKSHMRPLLEAVSRDEDADREVILERINVLLSAREVFYLKADDVVDTEGKSVEEVAEEITNVLGHDG